MHRNSFFNKLEEAILPALFQQLTDHMYGRGQRRPTFIEVGANDGISSSKTIDFIRHHEWQGLLVEPVPTVFAELEKNMAPYERVTAVNAAVAEREGTLPFFQVIGHGAKQDDVWLPMLSSFDRDVIMKQAVSLPDIADYVEQIDVRTLTIDSLCRDHEIETFDLLITDAEGYDDIIVRSIDFEQHRPMMINIEHIHISPKRLRELDALLMYYGYQRCIMWMDTTWFTGDILTDECVQRMIRTMPTLMPDYDPLYGNGYRISHYG